MFSKNVRDIELDRFDQPLHNYYVVPFYEGDFEAEDFSSDDERDASSDEYQMIVVSSDEEGRESDASSDDAWLKRCDGDGAQAKDVFSGEGTRQAETSSVAVQCEGIQEEAVPEEGTSSAVVQGKGIQKEGAQVEGTSSGGVRGEEAEAAGTSAEGAGEEGTVEGAGGEGTSSGKETKRGKFRILFRRSTSIDMKQWFYLEWPERQLRVAIMGFRILPHIASRMIEPCLYDRSADRRKYLDPVINEDSLWNLEDVRGPDEFFSTLPKRREFRKLPYRGGDYINPAIHSVQTIEMGTWGLIREAFAIYRDTDGKLFTTCPNQEW